MCPMSESNLQAKGSCVMIRKNFVFLAMGMLIILLCSASSADVPDSINYQGKLTTASGGCLNDTVQMTFTIYADESGTVSEWSETQTQVEVKDGIFNVLLGSVNPLPASIFDGSGKYLGVQVESDPEMSPLKPMVTTAYAFRSEWADTAEYASAAPAVPDDDWVINGDTIYHEPGNVGIGTASPNPASKLHLKSDPSVYVCFDHGRDTIWLVGSNIVDDQSLSILEANQYGSVHRARFKVGGDIHLAPASGNVGIGMPNPTEKLDVDGNIHASGTITSGSSIAIDGANDKITATSGTIDFDDENVITTGKATIGPGHTNTGVNAFVAGASNTANNYLSTVGGGESNTASGDRSTVGGGADNTASGNRSTVSGGGGNTASNDHSTVGGGRWNNATGSISTVSGGESNTASNEYSTVGGGSENTASGIRSTVGGGHGNTASGWHSTIGGGYGDTASGDRSTVGGGYGNTASGDYSTVSGGNYNINAGEYSVIPGGQRDTLTAAAGHTMAFGTGVYVDSPYRVVFFEDFYSGRLGINRDDRDGGINYPIHVGTATSNGNGARLTEGGVWTDATPVASKQKGQPLEGQELLAKIVGLSVETWQFRGSGERHIGPRADDFVEAFDVGTSREDGTRENQYLASSDVAGVALAGVKELVQQNQELRQIVEKLRQRIAELEKAK